jgi:hypothetical protein
MDAPTVHQMYFPIGGQLMILDSQFETTELYPMEITPELSNIIGIPSNRYYYYSLNSQKIPVFYRGPNRDQIRKDAQSYISNGSIHYRVVENLVATRGFDLYQLIKSGRTLSQWTDDQKEELTQFLIENRYHGNLHVEVTPRFIHDLIMYPINPGADLFKASALVNTKSTARIQQYLDTIGIVHFNAGDIINYDISDMLFWLTRFYGPPGNNLVAKGFHNNLLRQASNQLSRNIVSNINDDSKIIKYYDKLAIVIDQINKQFETAITDIMNNLQITNITRFYNSLVMYLPILERPILSPFRLGLAKDLNRNLVIEDVQYYTDLEIENILGTIIAEDRRTFISLALDKINDKNVFILTAKDAEICQNEQEDITNEKFNSFNTSYLGIGVLSQGLRCYDTEYLLQGLQVKDDQGIYLFRDSLNYISGGIITEDELRMISNLHIENHEEFLKLYQISKRQNEDTERNIPIIKAWVDQSEENKQIFRELFESLFYAGMYMRQWKGPGNPYPYKKGETGVTVEGLGRAPENVQEKSTEQLIKFKLVLDHKIPVQYQTMIYRLKYMDYDLNTFSKKPTTIQYYVEGLLSGEFCVRLSSAPSVYTAIYYLRSILGEQEIPSFNIKKQVVNIV